MCSIQIYFLFPKHSMSFITLCSYTLCLESWFLPTPSYTYPFSTWWAVTYPSRPRTTITSSFLPSQTPLKQIYLSLHRTLFITITLNATYPGPLSAGNHCCYCLVAELCLTWQTGTSQKPYTISTHQGTSFWKHGGNWDYLSCCSM